MTVDFDKVQNLCSDYRNISIDSSPLLMNVVNDISNGKIISHELIDKLILNLSNLNSIGKSLSESTPYAFSTIKEIEVWITATRQETLLLNKSLTFFRGFYSKNPTLDKSLSEFKESLLDQVQLEPPEGINALKTILEFERFSCYSPETIAEKMYGEDSINIPPKYPLGFIQKVLLNDLPSLDLEEINQIEEILITNKNTPIPNLTPNDSDFVFKKDTEKEPFPSELHYKLNDTEVCSVDSVTQSENNLSEESASANYSSLLISEDGVSDCNAVVENKQETEENFNCVITKNTLETTIQQNEAESPNLKLENNIISNSEETSETKNTQSSTSRETEGFGIEELLSIVSDSQIGDHIVDEMNVQWISNPPSNVNLSVKKFKRDIMGTEPNPRIGKPNIVHQTLKGKLFAEIAERGALLIPNIVSKGEQEEWNREYNALEILFKKGYLNKAITDKLGRFYILSPTGLYFVENPTTQKLLIDYYNMDKVNWAIDYKYRLEMIYFYMCFNKVLYIIPDHLIPYCKVYRENYVCHIVLSFRDIKMMFIFNIGIGNDIFEDQLIYSINTIDDIHPNITVIVGIDKKDAYNQMIAYSDNLWQNPWLTWFHHNKLVASVGHCEITYEQFIDRYLSDFDNIKEDDQTNYLNNLPSEGSPKIDVQEIVQSHSSDFQESGEESQETVHEIEKIDSVASNIILEDLQSIDYNSDMYLKTSTDIVLESDNISSQKEIEIADAAVDILPPDGWTEIMDGLMTMNTQAYAMAYMNSLATRYPSLNDDRKRLALAVNDPASQNDYSSRNVIELFGSQNSNLSAFEEIYYASSLRSFFDDRPETDYDIKNLYAEVTDLSLVKDCSYLGSIARALYSFRENTKHAPDEFADYRNLQESETRKKEEYLLQSMQSNINELFDSSNRCRINHPICQKVHHTIYSKDSDLYKVIKDIIDGNPDYDLIEILLRECAIKEGNPICRENINEQQINEWIDEIWTECVKKDKIVKSHSKGRMTGRNTFISKLRPLFADLADYMDTMQGQKLQNFEQSHYSSFNKLSTLLKDLIEKAVNELQNSEYKGIWIIINVLEEISMKLSGSWSTSISSFYIPFLHGGLVYLDDSWNPILNSIPTVPSLSIENRILEASHVLGQNLINRLERMETSIEFDLGTAGQIIHYLQLIDQEVSKDFQKIRWLNKESLEAHSRESVKSFFEDLELYQSYGRLDDTNPGRKDEMVRIVSDLLNDSIASGNYGLLNKVMDAMRQEINERAELIAIKLQSQLEAMKNDPDIIQDESILNELSKVQNRINILNLTSAEDLLNRIGSHDELSLSLELEDYLESFLEDFGQNYNQVLNSTKKLSELIRPKRVEKQRYLKDARSLIDSWPVNAHPAPDGIRNLLKHLGLMDYEVKEVRGEQNWYLYEAVPVLSEGEVTTAGHPLATFGSQIRKPGKALNILVVHGTIDADNILELIRKHKTNNPTILIANPVLNMNGRRRLARKLKESYHDQSILFIDRVTIAWMVKHYRLQTAAERLISVSAPFSYFQPYDLTASGNTPPEMFMGRAKELQSIKDPSGYNLVYGGRQLGKTALLRRAEKEINTAKNDEIAVYIDIKDLTTQEAASKIGFELFTKGILKEDPKTEDWDILYRAIRTRLEQDPPISYLLLLLDEADGFIESGQSNNYKAISLLENLQQNAEGRFKFILAGLRDVARFNKMTLSNNSPFGHLTSLTVRPFQYPEARELLEKPLFYLGFRFPEGEAGDIMISNILGQTNYFPGLIHLYGAKLIQSLRNNYGGFVEYNTPPYVVSENQIKKVLADENLLQMIKDKFLITLQVDNDNYYMILALLIAYLMQENSSLLSVSLNEILSAAHEWNIQKIISLDKNSVARLLEEMCELNVLQMSDINRWRFSRISFLSMLGTIDEIWERLDEISK